MDNYQNLLRMMDDINESTYGIRPYGTKRVIDLNSTVEELYSKREIGNADKDKEITWKITH